MLSEEVAAFYAGMWNSVLTGQEYLCLVLLIAATLFALGTVTGMRQKPTQWDAVAGLNLRISLEFSLSAVLFALVPFPLYHLFRLELVVWGLGSLLLALVLLVEIGRIYYKMNVLGARWPFIMATLLVLTSVVFTVEVVNFLWWNGLAGYAYGLLWLLIVAGLQLIAFIAYDAPLVERDEATFAAHRLENDPRYGHHGLLPERLRRERRADHSNRAPNHYANPYSDPVAVAKRERYANRYPFTRPNTRAGGTLPHAAVRRDQNPRAR
jgi:hypothetical protein